MARNFVIAGEKESPEQQRLAQERRQLRRDERREARRNRPGQPPEGTTPPPETETPPPDTGDGGDSTMGYDYNWQYADTEANVIDRTINAGVVSQWGVAMMIAKGPYPPGYKIASGSEGGSYPPQGQQSDGTLPIRIQPPVSGNGQRFMFYSTMTATVVNDTDTDGLFVFGLGVSYPSEVGRPMHPYLGVFHVINDFRKMAPISIPKHSAVCVSTIRMDVLDPDFAEISTWPEWKITPNADNKLYPAISPTMINPGKARLGIKDILCSGHAVPY
jgi:hypothetical protein